MTKLILKINTLWQVSALATTLRTGIFTIGHFFIDFFVITIITGAAMWEATAASIVSPLLNAAWYWILDRVWTQTHMDKESPSSDNT